MAGRISVPTGRTDIPFYRVIEHCPQELFHLGSDRRKVIFHHDREVRGAPSKSIPFKVACPTKEGKARKLTGAITIPKVHPIAYLVIQVIGPAQPYTSTYQSHSQAWESNLLTGQMLVPLLSIIPAEEPIRYNSSIRTHCIDLTCLSLRACYQSPWPLYYYPLDIRQLTYLNSEPRRFQLLEDCLLALPRTATWTALTSRYDTIRFVAGQQEQLPNYSLCHDRIALPDSRKDWISYQLWVCGLWVWIYTTKVQISVTICAYIIQGKWFNCICCCWQLLCPRLCCLCWIY